MRIRVRFVLIAIISLITMVPEFRIYSVLPDYTTKPIDAGKILESFDTADVKGSLVITYKDSKLNAYSGKMFDKLIKSFDMRGEILDWQSTLTDDWCLSLFFVLHEKEKIQYISIFKVNQYSDQIVLSNTFVVSGSEIINFYKDNNLIWIILQDSMNTINVYDLTGIKTCQIERKILNYVSVSGYSDEGVLFVYDGRELTKYVLISGIFKVVNSVSSFDVNFDTKSDVCFENEIFTMLLFDKKSIAMFDNNLNICFLKEIQDINTAKTEDGFFNTSNGSICIYGYVSLENNDKYLNCFNTPGYGIMSINSNLDYESWYSFSGNQSFGILKWNNIDNTNYLNYIAYSGLPKDIQFIIMDHDNHYNVVIYAYSANNVYIINDHYHNSSFRIKVLNASLPTNKNFLIDWDPYWICILIVILGVFATGMANVILRMF